MKVIKRNGKIVEFDIEKIKKAINGAIDETHYNADIDRIVEYIEGTIDDTKETITVEEIQDIAEEALMYMGYYAVAKAFIIYREKHNQDRIQAEEDWKFIENFVKSNNAANSTIDDNSNVGNKNIAVLNAEIHKKKNQNTNMYIWEKFLVESFPEMTAKQMRNDFNTTMYPHDSSSQIMMPYCQADSMYPFLQSGLKELGGKSAVPKSLESFCGMYVNLNFALASEVKGAVATPEFLLYFDYFARKEWGDNYYLKEDYKINTEACLKPKTIGYQIDQYFQQVTYSINQVAGSRGAQSPFTNFSFFDKYFFEGMFGNFYFPDGSQPQWESTNWVQKRYLHWLNQERLKCMLTFPVCSYACLIDENDEYKDKDTFEFLSQEYAQGNSFFTYLSKSVDSLSSCCRLQNAVKDNTFSFTNGQIGVMTGSKQVITLNMNRIVQDWWKYEQSRYESLTDIDRGVSGIDDGVKDYYKDNSDYLQRYLITILERVYKYHTAYNKLLHWAFDHNLFMAYKAGFINLDKQYLTVGIAGLNQAAEFLGIKCTNNDEYKEFCKFIFGTIKEQNTLHKTKHEMYNTEQVPAESAAIKLYNRDKKDGYWVPEDTNLYASYIFKPNDSSVSILDKITMHSSKFAADSLDGGVSAHLNLENHLSVEQYRKLLKYAAKEGCKYFTFNIPNTECDDCGFIAKTPFDVCPKCGSNHVTKYDRIIGYLTAIKNWSQGRQLEQKSRIYSKNVD